MKFLVVGCTQEYSTLHGMYEADVIEAKDAKEADSIASDYGDEAIDQWTDYEECMEQAKELCDLSSDDEFYEDRLNEICDELYLENKNYWTMKIKDEYQNKSIDELNELLHKVYGVDSFSDEYCISVY